MRRPLALLVAAALLVSACASAPPTPTPAPPKPAAAPTMVPLVQPTAPPTKAPEPTKPAAQPTAAAPQPTAAAKAPAYPEKGKAITLIMPWAAGGGSDVGARILAAALEKEMGISIQVVNKPGASTQTGMADLVKARPDGYTIGYPSLPTTINTYLDASRKAPYGRKDFLPIANHVLEATVIAVKVDSPFKEVKDLIDAAKAKPEQVKTSTSGLLSIGHLTALALERQTGAKLALVHFDGAGQQVPALLGGHVDLAMDTVSGFLTQARNGQLRILGVMDKQESKFYPGVKTLNAQGYNFEFFMSRGLAAPAGMSKEQVDILGAGIKKAMNSPEHLQKLDEMGLVPRYMDAAEYTTFWDGMEKQVKPLLDQALAK